MPDAFSGAFTGEPVDVHLDRTSVSITRHQAGAENATVVLPVQSFCGVMVQITPGSTPGAIRAKLILKHTDPQLSVLLADTERAEQLAAAWPAWASALELPMLVCDLGGRVKPIEAYSANPAGQPAPRRKLALLTGRRPRFLVRRQRGAKEASLTVHRDEREIIARS
ncbi:DUF6101 family protein [Roseibium suaedae]|uniref:Uncharacterized protein n=1 Tax=Roseibium suaedae TaxID=735517 RepID=A0A1M7AR91_9HYPH|nr:DUF6101 family protein [Roseibium suaedae]SHL45282.1 hypothetical protein SAMN05444272_0620 [Roseibium suaedae]